MGIAIAYRQDKVFMACLGALDEGFDQGGFPGPGFSSDETDVTLALQHAVQVMV